MNVPIEIVVAFIIIWLGFQLWGIKVIFKNSSRLEELERKINQNEAKHEATILAATTAATAAATAIIALSKKINSQ